MIFGDSRKNQLPFLCCSRTSSKFILEGKLLSFYLLIAEARCIEGEINLELALTFDIILKYTRIQYYALCNGVLHVSKFENRE